MQRNQATDKCENGLFEFIKSEVCLKFGDENRMDEGK